MLVDSSVLGEMVTFKELVGPGEKVTAKNLVKHIVCEEDGDQCRLSSGKLRNFSCSECKKKEEEFRNVLMRKLEEEQIENVNFIQWDFKNGRQRESHDMTPKDFVDKLLDDMGLLKSHNYMTTKQFDTMDDLKHSLSKNEVTIWMDYAENFQPPTQREVQTAHFKNNAQISILGAYIYYNRGNGIEEQSIVVLSDDTTHNTSAVFSSYIKLQEWLKEQMPAITKTTIVSDGCGGQFKNKYQFANIAYHENDFGHDCHWIFRY